MGGYQIRFDQRTSCAANALVVSSLTRLPVIWRAFGAASKRIVTLAFWTERTPWLWLLSFAAIFGALAITDTSVRGALLLSLMSLFVSVGIVREKSVRTRAIGCIDATSGALVGGLRLRLHRRRPVATIAGLFVAPEHAGRGIMTALVLGAFELLQSQPTSRPIRLTIHRPIHPASARLQDQVLGAHGLVIDPSPNTVFAAQLDALKQSVGAKGDRFGFVLVDPLIW